MKFEPSMTTSVTSGALAVRHGCSLVHHGPDDGWQQGIQLNDEWQIWPSRKDLDPITAGIQIVLFDRPTQSMCRTIINRLVDHEGGCRCDATPAERQCRDERNCGMHWLPPNKV